MTIATPEQQIAVMQAALKGKRIQYRFGSLASDWLPVSKPTWNWTSFEYRVDPTDRDKKIVPLDRSDFDSGNIKWVRSKGSPNSFWLVVGTSLPSVYFGSGWFTFITLQTTYEYLDANGNWVPCQKEIFV